MTRCLVIGGNGFLGAPLVDALLADGHEVTVFDRLSRTPRFDAERVTLHPGDFLNVGHLREAVRGQDVIYHFLSTTTPATAEDDPLIDIRTNVTGTVELLRLAVEADVKHLYFASTGGAIYGDSASPMTDESALPQPFSPYGIGKLTIERYLDYFRKTHGLMSTSFRISNPYGPGQSATRTQGVIPIFLRSLAEDRPLTVFGDGSMSRDFIYVTDVARMVAATLSRPLEHTTYNIGSGISYTLNDVIDAISLITGRKPLIEHRAVPPTYVDHVSLDTRRFSSEFGELPFPIPLSDGIRRTWHELVGDA